MFRLEHNLYLWALLLIPLMSIFFVLMRRRRRQALNRFGDWAVTQRLMPQVSNVKHQLKFVALMLALAFLIIAWCNPQWGLKKEKVQHKSADVIIALDISMSMWCDDIKPSRLERAKSFALRLLESLKGERVGLILFAGNAYLQMPLTNDYTSAALFVQSANPNQAPTQGTNIGGAIDIASEAFGKEGKHHKALIVISDGESFDDDAMTKAAAANEDGMILFTVGVGTTQGGFIPLNLGTSTDFKRDEQGQPVKTALNEPLLNELATKADGVYFNLNQNNDIVEALQEKVDKMDKKDFEQRVFSDFETYYQYFVFAALFIILLEFMLPYRRSTWLEDKDIFKTS